MADETGVWEVRLGLYCTRERAEEIKERIGRLLCPDPGHAPPCPVPWSVSLRGSVPGPDEGDGGDDDVADAYPELIEQARIEQTRIEQARIEQQRERGRPAGG